MVFAYPGPLVEFPDQGWNEVDAAEYPDQALLCPDDQESTEEWYPVNYDFQWHVPPQGFRDERMTQAHPDTTLSGSGSW